MKIRKLLATNKTILWRDFTLDSKSHDSVRYNTSTQSQCRNELIAYIEMPIMDVYMLVCDTFTWRYSVAIRSEFGLMMTKIS